MNNFINKKSTLFIGIALATVLFTGCTTNPTPSKNIESKKIDNKINWKYCEDMDYDGSAIIE
jgi:hypothetical protein